MRIYDALYQRFNCARYQNRLEATTQYWAGKGRRICRKVSLQKSYFPTWIQFFLIVARRGPSVGKRLPSSTAWYKYQKNDTSLFNSCKCSILTALNHICKVEDREEVTSRLQKCKRIRETLGQLVTDSSSVIKWRFNTLPILHGIIL